MPAPCFQFYPEEFVGSGTVGTADAKEIAVYVLLLCLDWTEGGFVYDAKRLARWCKVSQKVFTTAWKHLAHKFTERDGRFYNNRLDKERAKQEEWRAKSKKGAEITNEKRWGPPEDASRQSGQGGDEMATANGVANGSPEGRIPLPLPLPLPSPTPLQPQTTLPAVRKSREPRPLRETWLTPSGEAWETANGKGSFPYAQAGKELKPLADAGHSPETIGEHLAWYLRVRGLDTLDPDPEIINRTRFTPSLRDFRLRFAKFDPRRTS